MAEDRIDVVVTDKIDKKVAPNIKAIADAAAKAEKGLSDLKKQIAGLNGSGVADLKNKIDDIANAMNKAKVAAGGANGAGGLAGALRIVGTLIGTGIIAAVGGAVLALKTFSSNSKFIADAAKMFGITTTKVQELEFAIKRMSDGAAKLSDLKAFGSNFADAAVDSENRLARLFSDNNLSLTDRQGKLKDINALLRDAASLVQNAKSEFDKIKIVEILGLSEDWIKVLEQGPQALDDMQDAAKDAGAVFQEELIKRGQELDKTLTDGMNNFLSVSKFVLITVGDWIATSLIKPATDFLVLMGQAAGLIDRKDVVNSAGKSDNLNAGGNGSTNLPSPRRQRNGRTGGGRGKQDIDFLARTNRELDQQIKSYGLLGDEKEIQIQMDQILNQLADHGEKVSQDQIASLKAKIIQIQKLEAVSSVLNDIYDETTGALNKVDAAITANGQAFALGLISADAYNTSLAQLNAQAASIRLTMGDSTWSDVFTTGLGQVIEGYKGVLSGLGSSFGEFFQNVGDGFADSIGRAIVYSEDLGTALHSVAQSALADLISSLVKLGIQWLVTQAIGQSIGTAATATTAAQAGVVASAWAPAAALASLATLGANSAPAAAALSATTALSTALSKTGMLSGFAAGGYTGNGGTSSVAGLVHGREFVVNAAATRNNRAALEAMNAGRTAAPTGGPRIIFEGAASAFVYPNVTSPDEVRIIAKDEARKMVQQEAPRVIASDISNTNGRVSKALNRNTKTQRKRGG